MKQRFYLLLGLIVLMAAILRLVNLGEYPQRFNQDEMAQGYDAWSIWRTGRDQHGTPFPIQFRNYNDYIPPVGNYITAPFVGLLGMDETTTRLPVALFGIATVALVGLLGRLWFGELAGLLAALLLTFEPWHLNYSRIAFPAGFVPFFTAAALYTYTRGIMLLSGDEANRQRRSLYWLGASALSFALLTASYSTMKLQAPLLIGTCAMAGAFVWWRNWRIGLAWLGLIALLISPYAIFQLTNWEVSQFRFNEISVFQMPDWPQVWWANYRAHYDLQAWFIVGLQEGVAVHPAGIGELFWFEAPLMLIAGLGLLQGRFWQRSQLLLPVLVIIWLLTFPMAASFTNHGIPHEIRTYNLLPLPELLSGYGLVLIWEWGAKTRWRRVLSVVFLDAAVFTFFVFNVLFLRYFFGPLLLHENPEGQEVYENVGLRPALEKVRDTAQACDIIWVEPMNQTYMYYLFLTRTPPEQFQQAQTVRNTDHYLNIKWMDNIRFGAPDFDTIDAPPIPGCEGQPSHTYFVTRRPSMTDGWQDLIVVRNDAGGVLWRAAREITQTP
jgi:4-amino-4-deoxy-L-arabinose transferase-like glycosyltransferase